MSVAAKIAYSCPACRMRANIPSRFAGRRINCPGCRAAVRVDHATPPAAPRPTPPRAQAPAPVRTPAPAIDVAASTIRFACPVCTFQARIPARAAGRRLHCPKCRSVVPVTAASDPATPADSGHGSAAARLAALLAQSAPTSARAVAAPVAAAPAPAPRQPQPVAEPEEAEAEATTATQPEATEASDSAAIAEPSAEADVAEEADASPAETSGEAPQEEAPSDGDGSDPSSAWTPTPAPQPILVAFGNDRAKPTRAFARRTVRLTAPTASATRPPVGLVAARSPFAVDAAEPGDDSGEADARDRTADDDDEADASGGSRRSVSERRHRQQPAPRRTGRRLAVVAMLAAAAWFGRDHLQALMPRAAVAPVAAAAPARPAAASAAPAAATISTASGTVVANAEVEVVCSATGTVGKMPFAVGDAVAAGAVVAELDASIEESAVRKAQAQMALAQGLLLQAQQNLLVAERQLEGNRAEGKAAVASAESRAREVAGRSERQRRLLEKKLCSVEEAESAREQAVQAEADAESARARLKRLDADDLALEIHRQDIAVQQAQVQADQLELDEAKRRLAGTRMTSPIAGVLCSRHVDIGGWMPEGGAVPVVTIADVSRLFVAAKVAERDLGRISVGQETVIHVPAFPDRAFVGRVAGIAARGEAGDDGATFEVRVEAIGDALEALRPAMTASVDFGATPATAAVGRR